APTITQPTNYVVCDDNNDGVSCLFDLSTKDAEISTQAGIQITYHLTLTDSQTNSNALSKTTPYCNITNPQTIYVRVFNPSAPACSSFTTFQLIVNPKPVANLPQDYHLCAPTFGATSAVFNLTSVVTPQVLGSTLPAANYTVTYYESLSDAQAPINAITPASAYPSGTKKLWIRVQNNATGCFDIITVQLVLDPLPTVLSFYAQYELCETTAPIGKEFFNLDSKVNYILQSQLGMQVTFYPTLAQAQAGTGAITNTSAYENVPLYVQTIGIRVTNTTTGCYSISTMDLVVNPKPQPIPQAQPYTVCDTDQDGKACFDLNTLTPNITFQTAGVYTITYHPTLSDAQNNLNPISTATPYCNTTPFIQFLWIRAENPTTGCYNTMQIELNVDPAPVAPTNLATIAKCDQDANPQDGCTSFNLTAQNPAILAQEPLAGSNYTISYYTTQGAASSNPAGAAIVPATNYTSCVPSATIWVRVQNNATGCYSVGSFDIQVNTPIVLTTPTLYSVCDNDSQPNNLYTTFNLTTFIGNIAGHTIAFYKDAAHTQLITNPSAFVNTIAATQTIFLVVTNTTTGCKSYRTLTLQVLPIPVPNTNLSAPQYLLEACDNNYTTTPNDGYEVFNLTTNAAYISNGDTNVTLHYYPSYADATALPPTNEITMPTSASVNGNVWIRVESNNFIGSDSVRCYVLVEQPVKVNPLPLITPNVVYQECDNDTDGFTQFNLNSQAAALLSTNPAPLSNYSLTFYATPPPSAAISNPGSYTNTNTTGNTQTIYVIATNNTTGCKSPVGQFTIMVNPKPVLNKPADFAHCDDEVGDNDGYYAYDLNLLVPAILGATQPQTDYTVNFYDTQYNPPLLTPTAIPAASWGSYQAYTHTLWVSVTNNNTGCERIDSFNILIEQPPTPVITADSNVICVDFNTHQVVRDLVLTADNQTVYLAGSTIPTYTYQWFDAAGVAVPGATAMTYTVASTLPNDISTTYTVVMTSTTLGCPAESPDFTVLQSGQAVAAPAGTSGYTVTNAFSENQTITVTVDGYGSYQFSLDDGPRQNSNVFENVSLGQHNITVWDTEGGLGSSCDPLVLTGVLSIDYPHYFTPNGDGINDYWNIVG
ncbi:adhesin, partial [Flavobacterium sp. SUN052]|nr:adhesin [Flavobacterium sp. SUN052]